ncbi:MAG: hypothetical protein H8E15_04640 [Planctomycetes bacterium]|nr:hypothetical protein [Planctomycetota bacterium]
MKLFSALIFAGACSLVHAQQPNPVEAIESVRLQLPKNEIFSILSISAALVDLEDVHTSFSNRRNIRSNGEVILKLQDPLNPPKMARLHLYVPGGIGLEMIYSKPFAVAGRKHRPADVINVEVEMLGIGKLELSLPFDRMNEEQRSWLVEDSDPMFHFIRPLGSPLASMEPAPRFQAKRLNFGPPWRPNPANRTRFAPTLPPRYFSIEKRENEFHVKLASMASGEWFVWLSGTPGWRTLPVEINVQPNQDNEWVLPPPVQEKKWYIQFPDSMDNSVFPCLVWERIGDEPLISKHAELDDERSEISWTYFGEHCKQLFLMKDVGGFGRGTKHLYFWNLEMDEVKKGLDSGHDLHPCLDLREMVPEISYKLPAIEGVEFCWFQIKCIKDSEESLPLFPREGIS